MDSLNYQGVKFGKQINDFIIGVNHTQNDSRINLSEKWKEYRSQHELQNKGFETYACTVFSGFDALETLINFYIKNNRVSPDDLKFLNNYGYLTDGLVNFSDRFAAQYAEIEVGKGTYQFKANHAIVKYLIPELMLPYSIDGYYDKSKITKEMLDLSEEFRRRFVFNWYWVENTDYILQYTPLTGVVKYAGGDGILKPVGYLNHCIMIPSMEKDYFDVDDNYAQQDKKYDKNYVFNFVGYSLTLKIELMNVEKFLVDNDLRFIRNKNTGALGRILQGMLRTVEGADRAALLLMDNEIRKNGLEITDGEWQSLVKANKVKPF